MFWADLPFISGQLCQLSGTNSSSPLSLTSLLCDPFIISHLTLWQNGTVAVKHLQGYSTGTRPIQHLLFSN